jgi:hypothetical protein
MHHSESSEKVVRSFVRRLHSRSVDKRASEAGLSTVVKR